MALVAFVIFTLVGQTLNVLFCLALDNIFSPTVGGLTFVVLYILVFGFAYKLALFFFDREEPQPTRKQTVAKDAASPRMPRAALRRV